MVHNTKEVGVVKSEISYSRVWVEVECYAFSDKMEEMCIIVVIELK